ncbi:hypothetical protein, partial [Brunnivagina elsteri]|uniref:hypothetical protein n=1 Tax=Brunnivagina elsteri TaxID=1247191 RepID=UPI001B803063
TETNPDTHFQILPQFGLSARLFVQSLVKDKTFWISWARGLKLYSKDYLFYASTRNFRRQ